MWNYFNPVEIIFGENKFKEVHDALKNKNYIIITHPEEIFKKYSDVVISVLIGFLGGSLFKIWPFYEVLQYNSSNEPIYTTPILPTANQSSDLIFFFYFC